jgi:DNA-binding NtrC family response regulator
MLSKDKRLAEAIGRVLGSEFEVRHGSDLELKNWNGLKEWCDLVFLDMRPMGIEGELDVGIRLMGELQRTTARPPIVVFCDEFDKEVSEQALNHGAHDTITNPPNIAELRSTLRQAHKIRSTEKELERLRIIKTDDNQPREMVGTEPVMQELFALTKRTARHDINILITGETGTGKELLARAIHQMSPRAAHPLVAFSCANLPETLIEDELFGHQKGAFTGALNFRCGRLEAANRGTLFLDEVGDIDLALQPKLLRVIQERRFERLGSNVPIDVDIRLIAATNRNLSGMVLQGKFREDLYYRLNVIELHIPPLRERREDIPLLAQHFLQIFAHRFAKQVRRFSPPALYALQEYAWPGNVRELENAIQRAVVLSDGLTIEVSQLPNAICDNVAVQNLSCSYDVANVVTRNLSSSYEEEVRRFKRRLILRTLRACNWSKSESARNLGVARPYLHRLINQLEIRVEEESEPATKCDEQLRQVV